MREILFRGKRKDNGEWVYGYYATQSNHACFQSELKYTSFILKDEFIDWGLGGLAEYEVIPESVGQFTGLTDKNGNKIFEGDIVKEWSSHWKTPSKTEINIYSVVCEYLGSLHLIRKTAWGENSTPLYRRSIVEVIGNIYDNPELLGK